jgi:hypothetical protein
MCIADGDYKIQVDNSLWEDAGCSQRLQFMGESVESLRNSTDRDGL